MRLWNNQSISGKLTWMNLLVSGTALLLAYISFLAYDLYTLRQNLIATLNTEAAIVGANSVTALLFDDQRVSRDRRRIGDRTSHHCQARRKDMGYGKYRPGRRILLHSALWKR